MSTGIHARSQSAASEGQGQLSCAHEHQCGFHWQPTPWASEVTGTTYINRVPVRIRNTDLLMTLSSCTDGRPQFLLRPPDMPLTSTCPAPQAAKPCTSLRHQSEVQAAGLYPCGSQALSWPGEAAWTTVTSLASGDMTDNYCPLRMSNPESGLCKRDLVVRRHVQGLGLSQHKLQVTVHYLVEPTGPDSMTTPVLSHPTLSPCL